MQEKHKKNPVLFTPLLIPTRICQNAQESTGMDRNVQESTGIAVYFPTNLFVRYVPMSCGHRVGSDKQVGSWGYRNCSPSFSLGSRESHSYIGSEIRSWG